MHIATASEPGSTDTPNEDWAVATSSLIVVLDGATARTDTGCRHGVPWYAAKLGAAIVAHAADHSQTLEGGLADSIADVAALHPECDLTHPGTPSAAVAVLRVVGDSLEYLTLGDTSTVLETTSAVQVINDDRVDSTARAERSEADRYPIGSPEKRHALIRMKRAELAARNQPGGFWVAANDPAVATHALTGAVPLRDVSRLAVLTDGAARVVSPFGFLDWPGVLDTLDKESPSDLIQRVRSAEASDPDGNRWPRNKRSDDATVVYVSY